MKAFIVAGTHSGSGKTTITLGLMAALKQLGHKVMPFKCGPDFIDPSLHCIVTGNISRNLDIWMAGPETVQQSFTSQATRGDIAVVEGVMGMFDGGTSSSAELADFLQIPLILVIDVRSMAESAAAVVKGFESLHPKVQPAGVILNRIASPRHYQLAADAITAHCRSNILGYLPSNIQFTIPERHLGLHMGEESPLKSADIAQLASTIEQHIDLPGLLELAEIKDAPPAPHPVSPVHPQRPIHAIRLGIARDKAFCFYYQDNFDILEQEGAELCFFSPLQDKALPPDLDGLYLGGGYPELYGKTLASNSTLLQEIRSFHEQGRPLYAECGGFMYLTRGITDLAGEFHPLVNIFPCQASMKKKRASLGYRELTTDRESCWGPAGTILRGHEFHYSTISDMEENDSCPIERIYTFTGKDKENHREGYRIGNTLGGYMHLHFGFNRTAISNFIDHCRG